MPALFLSRGQVVSSVCTKRIMPRSHSCRTGAWRSPTRMPEYIPGCDNTRVYGIWSTSLTTDTNKQQNWCLSKAHFLRAARWPFLSSHLLVAASAHRVLKPQLWARQVSQVGRVLSKESSLPSSTPPHPHEKARRIAILINMLLIHSYQSALFLS